MSVKQYRVPPWLASLMPVYLAAVMAGVPTAVSRIGRRHGWNGTSPGRLNLLGLVPLAAGLGMLFWVGGRHLAQWRDRDWKVLKIDLEHLLTPDYLVTDGPYRFSRNPMHLGTMSIFAGWAILLGSIPVAVLFVVVTVAIVVFGRLEERGLARQFGDQWDRYAAITPRWLGRRRPESALSDRHA